MEMVEYIGVMCEGAKHGYAIFKCPACGAIVTRRADLGKRQKHCSQECLKKEMDSNGYVSPYKYMHYPSHPRATKDGNVLEHIVVAENKIGRELADDEVVHHINGDGRDNRPENLIVVSSYEHRRIHGKALLNCDDVLIIRALHDSGVAISEIAGRFGIKWWHAWSVATRRRWKNYPPEAPDA